MSKINLMQTIRKKNPIAAARRKKMRSLIRNTEASFLCPNCIGGILFHDLGMRFYSPTVNLMMRQDHFIRFVLNREDYLREILQFYEDENYSCPCAHLGDIDIHFTHYKTREEARDKWIDRSRRIDDNNLFIFAEERDGIGEYQIRELGKVSARGVLVFTAHQYQDIPYAQFLPSYEKEGEVGNILKRSFFDDSREYEKYFDFVKWFNEADGGDYDITPYIRG